MEPSRELSDIYQLRIVLKDISPLIWRRVLVRDDTTLAQLHDIIQSLFDWCDEHLHHFHIYGKDYGANGADTRRATLKQFRFRNGERFRYVYDYYAYWVCDIRLEATLPLAYSGGNLPLIPAEAWFMATLREAGSSPHLSFLLYNNYIM